MKKIKLSDWANIRSGLVLARKQSSSPTENNYKLLTLKSISSNGYIEKDLLEDYYATEKLNSNYISQKDDIIVRISSPYTAVLIDGTTEGFVISSYFTVIRSNKNKLLPEYLYWLLNNEETLKTIQKNNFGNILGSIRPQFFSDMEIFLLPLNEQQRISELNLLFMKEQKLLEDLKNEKKLKAKLVLEKYYGKMKGNR
ncbi:MAG: restriction endonuclease subunit S [Anaerotignum propionicum]|uniref:restriction endonuclease subunit S n=1 Tax=Anaerotignum propionicum TaxID=28446 RepID=UPI002B200117|nr:restriction endonuclease subunit S [Anaerotignum propionicum]MEA5057226.1 restriction endonuclease subunit S [Anaerotignum propionicum]